MIGFGEHQIRWLPARFVSAGCRLLSVLDCSAWFPQFPASSRSASTMLVLFGFSTGAPPSCFPEHILQRLVLVRNSSAFLFPSGFLFNVCLLSRGSFLRSLVSRVRLEESRSRWAFWTRHSRDLLTNSRSVCNCCWLLAAVSRPRLCGTVFSCTSEGNLLLHFSTFLRQIFPLGLSRFPSQKNTSSPNAVSEKRRVSRPFCATTFTWRHSYLPHPHPLPHRVADIVTNPSRSQYRTALTWRHSYFLRHSPTPPQPCGRHRDKPLEISSLHRFSHDVTRTFFATALPLPNRVADIVTNPSRSHHCTASHMTSLVLSSPQPHPSPTVWQTSWQTTRDLLNTARHFTWRHSLSSPQPHPLPHLVADIVTNPAALTCASRGPGA